MKTVIEKTSFLSGQIKNRTVETALAVTLLALFFLTRTFTIPLGLVTLDFSGAIIHSAASILAWPYTLVFAFSTLYLGSNVYGTLAFLVGNQLVFILSKTLKKRWLPHLPGVGTLAGMIAYGLFIHNAGLMDFNVYLTVLSPIIVFVSITTYLGGLLVWRVVRSFGVVE